MPKPVSAIDSHFHLERTLATLGLPPNRSIDDIMRATSVDEGEVITIEGAVAVYCDPSTYPSAKTLIEFSDGLAVAVCVHPVNVSQASDAQVQTLQALLKSPQVRVLGEIGLNRSASPKQRSLQIRFKERVLPFLEARHFLVLHCRGMNGEEGTEAYLTLLALL